MKAAPAVLRPVAPAVLLLAVVMATLAATPVRHFGLARSAPEDRATVHALTEVRLWFTQAPSEGTVSIRVLGPTGEPVRATDAARDPEDAKVYHVQLQQPAAPGAYRVSWRGMGEDGHVVKGELSFTVAAHH